MWIFYSERSLPTAVDCKSAVKRLKREFSKLAFVDSHKQLYKRECVFDIKFCQKLEVNYRKGICLCTNFLDSKEELNFKLCENLKKRQSWIIF